MKFKSIIMAFLWSSPILMLAQQQPIQLDDVVQTAIENNFNIKIAKNNIEVAATNATIGAAGFLPTIDFSGGYTYSNNNSKTTFSGNIPDQNEPAAASHNFNANLNLRYTIFDGLKPVYQLKKSKVDVQLSNTQYQQQIETTIYNVIQAYYNLALLQEDYRIATEKLELTKIQLKRIETQRKYGQGSEVERLNLLTSYNSDSTQLLRLKLNMRQAVRQLNKALGTEEVADDAIVQVDTELDLSLNYETVKEAALKNNLMVISAQQNIEKANLDYQITKTELFPKLNTTITYGYNGSRNDVGIVKTSDAFGPSVNLGLTYTIYGAGAVKRAKIQNRLNIKNQELNLELVQYDIEQSVKDAYSNHENNMALIPLEESNVVISKQSFDRITKAYNLGQASLLDYQRAELNYIQAQKQVITAKYNAKLSEWELRRLAGTIAK
ncbi:MULTISPECIES: TolC family protein [unclassified Aureispira]|uniref:TolC family protein n=1 Tax=unclassified Aureispira TaxID=2649989 RepID=UPI0006961A07|nr:MULTISPECIES: TolC family protein [unclassified Aureispira]WMX13613.1 TolC family protein [Aureispira sp. CCB-E]